MLKPLPNGGLIIIFVLNTTQPVQFLTLSDLLLTPVYLFVLIAIARKQRNKRYSVGHPLRTYYMKGLYVKLGGAIFIGLVYQYYYGGGDTFHYFIHAKIINSSLDSSIGTWIKLVTHQSLAQNSDLFPYTSQMWWYNDSASYSIASIAAVLGLLNGTTYIPIALLFAFISYSGVWAMYRTFVNLYPKLHKQLALAFLFIPSVFVWGSSIFKDTVCMFGLGWMIYTSFRIFINKDLSFKNISFLALSFYLVGLIKIYILMAFLPAISLWLLMTYSKNIRSAGMQWLLNLGIIAVAIGGFFFFTQKFAKELDKYSLDKIAQTASITRTYLGHVSDVEGGSGYDLGEFDPSIRGMITKFPQAVTVTLFRPFLWESRKPIVFLSALEALVFLYFSYKVFITNRKTLKIVFKDPNVIFCFIFSVIFAFAVGISSYNFGTLSRYKIPCLPFYAVFLVVSLYKEQPERTAVSLTKKESPRQKRLRLQAQPTI